LISMISVGSTVPVASTVCAMSCRLTASTGTSAFAAGRAAS
jgi:hypothetical protein